MARINICLDIETDDEKDLEMLTKLLELLTPKPDPDPSESFRNLLDEDASGDFKELLG